jgi:putative transposase
MENYRSSAHTRYDIKYHFVWITKYRKPALIGQVGLRLRELVREICRTNDVEILQGHVGRDHVHILVSAPPNISASKIMQYIKGKTSRKLMMEFRHLNKQFWGRHLWGRGFFVTTSGNVTDEVIREYIRLQETQPEQSDDTNFRVEGQG